MSGDEASWEVVDHQAGADGGTSGGDAAAPPDAPAQRQPRRAEDERCGVEHEDSPAAAAAAAVPLTDDPADGATRTVLQPGLPGSEPAPPLSRVFVNVRAWRHGDEAEADPVMDHPREELDFVVGKAEVPRALDVAVCQMLPGELARVDTGPTYGGDAGRTVFVVRVVRWEAETSPFRMTAARALAYAEGRRELGARLFRCGKPETALRVYQHGVEALELRFSGLVPDGRGPAGDVAVPLAPEANAAADGDEERDRALGAAGVLLGNAGVCHFSLKRAGEAEAAFTRSLAAAPGAVKTLRRRAKARELLGRNAGAAEDLRAALRLVQAAGDDAVAAEVSAALKRAEAAERRDERRTAERLGRGLARATREGKGLYGDKPGSAAGAGGGASVCDRVASFFRWAAAALCPREKAE